MNFRGGMKRKRHKKLFAYKRMINTGQIIPREFSTGVICTFEPENKGTAIPSGL